MAQGDCRTSMSVRIGCKRLGLYGNGVRSKGNLSRKNFIRGNLNFE